MTQPGAPAALRGYRLQALYTLQRVFESGLSEAYLCQPEGIEDLDIHDSDSNLVEAIQVKSYSNLTLSDLEPQKANSFFRRAVDLLDRENAPAIRLINFGTVGPELRQALDGDPKHRGRVASKLVARGFKRDDVETLLQAIELISVTEEAVRGAILDRIRMLATGIDPVHALDLFVAWYYRLAERRQAMSCNDLVTKINSVSRFLAERYHYNQEWFSSVVPLEDVLIEEEQLPRLREEYYAGVSARFDHILANLDFLREHKLTEISEAFREHNVVIVHAASGQGKTTLAYRYLHDWYPNKWRYAVQRIQDVRHALGIARALSGFAEAVDVPIAVHIDVHPQDVDWQELVKQLAAHSSLKILVTIREEDYRRASPAGVDFRFADVSLEFDREEAQRIYNRASYHHDHQGFLDFDAAWDAFGGKGPLMEFVYLLTQTETLQQRLSGQVQRIQDEVRSLTASPDELRLLTLVSIASAYGARLRTQDTVERLGLPAPDATLRRFEKEYLLRQTTEGLYLEGLHPVRSQILVHLLVKPDVNPWLEVITQVLRLIPEKDLETFILHALIDRDDRADIRGFLESVTALRLGTWAGIAGVFRSLLWVGARDYVEANKAVLDSAYREMGAGWMFAVDLDLSQDGEGPELGQRWTTMGSLMPPDKQARISVIRDSQTPKEAVFQRSREWLTTLDVPPSCPTTPRDWEAVAEVWYWGSRLILESPQVQWITDESLDAAVNDLPLTILADVSLSLHLCGPERHQRWLKRHEDALRRRLADELAILALEETDTMLKFHFIPLGESERHGSDPLHDRTMDRIDLVRRLFPGYERYGSQGYGFRPAGIELPQGDSTHKEGVLRRHLLPPWLVTLNGVVSGLARLRYRSASWGEYLDMIIGVRRSIVDRLRDLGQAIVKYLRRDKPINVGLEAIDLEAWLHGRQQLTEAMDLPRSAVDPWGFASETSARARTPESTQQYVPVAIALRKYEPYLKIQRKYFAAVRAFLEQASAVWVTNANAGKLRSDDPRRAAVINALKDRGIETDASLTLLNLYDGKELLASYQESFRSLFARHVPQHKLAALEEAENEIWTMVWVLWYYYANESWRGAADPVHQAPKWMERARRRFRGRIREALQSIQTDQRSVVLLDRDEAQWQGEPTLWVTLDVADPPDLYTALEDLLSALRDTLDNPDRADLELYLIRDVCQRIVVVPLVRGKMLDALVWPISTLPVLLADDVQDRPFAYLPSELPQTMRDDLSLACWQTPEILAANQLSTSVLGLRQLVSHLSEFQQIPDLTEPGVERLQRYMDDELVPEASGLLQDYIDAAAEIFRRFHDLSDDELCRNGNTAAAVATLAEIHDRIIPGEGDGEWKLDLGQIAEYSERLEAVFPVVLAVRSAWIAGVLSADHGR